MAHRILSRRRLLQAMLFALLHSTVLRVRLAIVALALAWAFLWQRYAPINLGIRYVAPFFVLQALLLVLCAMKGEPELHRVWGPSRVIGVGLFLHALVARVWPGKRRHD